MAYFSIKSRFKGLPSSWEIFRRWNLPREQSKRAFCIRRGWRSGRRASRFRQLPFRSNRVELWLYTSRYDGAQVRMWRISQKHRFGIHLPRVLDREQDRFCYYDARKSILHRFKTLLFRLQSAAAKRGRHIGLHSIFNFLWYMQPDCDTRCHWNTRIQCHSSR